MTVSENYNVHKKEYRLTLKQHCPNTPGQTKKAPFHIPLKASLLLDKGSKVSQKERAYFAQEVLLEFTHTEQSWVVKNIPAKPVLSINRNFSAPIILEHKQSEDELLTLLAEDTDPFSRWESAQKLAQQIILAGRLPNTKLIDAYRVILQDPNLDPAFKSPSIYDFSFFSTSPLIGTADPGIPPSSFSDIEQKPRDGSPDKGAYEF